jgi:putative cell wall-binding protein
MSDEESKSSFPDESQRYAVCESKWSESKMSVIERYRQAFASKISFDYDGVLSTAKGKEKALQLIKDGNTIYIISARGSKDNMLTTAKDLGIPESRIYATGSNKAKVEKIKELGIDTHYDNNPDVIKELGSVGKLFTNG